MTIRKNKPPPNLAGPRTARTHTKTKSKGSKSKSVGSAAGGGSTKGTGQVKGGTNAFSVDQVDHADPDQKRGRQQFQSTDGPKAENLSTAAKKAVAQDGQLRRADNGQAKNANAKDAGKNAAGKNGQTKAEARKEVRQDHVRGDKLDNKGTRRNKSEASQKKKSTNAAADDDDDGVQIKAAKLAAANSSKVGTAQAARTNKTQKSADAGGGKKDGAGGVEGKGKGKGHARVEKKSMGERLEANEKASIAVESSGLTGGAGVEGAANAEGVEQTASAGQVEGVGTIEAPEMASLSASVESGSKGLGRKESQPGDQKFSAAIKDVPKGEITDSGIDLARGSLIEREMTDVARGQLESDVQREMSVDAKEKLKSSTAGLFDDVADAIADDGGIDGVLGSSTSRAKAEKKGVTFVRDKNDGTRRGIDQPVEKAISDMAGVTGNAGINASDIAQDTTKMKNDGEGDDEGEVEEDEEDGEED